MLIRNQMFINNYYLQNMLNKVFLCLYLTLANYNIINNLHRTNYRCC